MLAMSDGPHEEREPRLPEGYSLNYTDEDGPMALASEDDGRVVAVFPALTSAEEVEALAWEIVGGTPPVDNDPKEERGTYLPSGYTLDETDPDAIVLRRPDGSEVGTFSAVGAGPREVERSAWEDFGGREG